MLFSQTARPNNVKKMYEFKNVIIYAVYGG